MGKSSFLWKFNHVLKSAQTSPAKLALEEMACLGQRFYYVFWPISWYIQILSRLMRHWFCTDLEVIKGYRTAPNLLINTRIKLHTKETAHLHSPQQLQKNPAEVPAILSPFPCVLFLQPWIFSMFTFRLLIPVFHANRNGWIRAGKAFTQHTNPPAL